jgi:polyisoprenoid-binding protein YceI
METPTIKARKTKWVLDPAHSEISFKVKHLMITNVKGEFRKFNADVTTIGDDPATATVHAVIDTDSIIQMMTAAINIYAAPIFLMLRSMRRSYLKEHHLRK